MNANNFLMNNSNHCQIISEKEKIENDKERIKTKFKFNISKTSTNSSAIKQSSLQTQNK